MNKIQDIRNKKVRAISIADVADELIVLSSAKNKLNAETYAKIEAKYNAYKKQDKLYNLGLQGYLKVAAQILIDFNNISPVEVYCSSAPELEYLQRIIDNPENTDDIIKGALKKGCRKKNYAFKDFWKENWIEACIFFPSLFLNGWLFAIIFLFVGTFVGEIIANDKRIGYIVQTILVTIWFSLLLWVNVSVYNL